MRKKGFPGSLYEPRNIEDLVGQKHLFSPGKPLYEIVLAKQCYSLLLVGPPGCGKTSFLKVLQESFSLSDPIQSALKFQLSTFRRRFQAKGFFGPQKILLLEELHHLNRKQQDLFLPYLESGELILCATTTENPYYIFRSALLSRLQIFHFEPLSEKDLEELLEKVVARHPEISIRREVREKLIAASHGDGRRLMFYLCRMLDSGRSTLELEDVEALAEKGRRYDQKGDEHYQNISAFIKSVRGSDPDAAIFYLARMLSGGEDPRFIARRMVILASEDIGNADPVALLLANAASDAVERVGLPEAELNLAHVALYLACAPKSNASTLAWKEAKKYAAKQSVEAVPQELRNPVPQAPHLGWGDGYEYPHDFEGHYVPKSYLPGGAEVVFYSPTEQGREKRIGEHLARLRGKRKRKK